MIDTHETNGSGVVVLGLLVGLRIRREYRTGSSIDLGDPSINVVLSFGFQTGKRLCCISGM